MLTKFLILAIVGLLGVLSHRRSRLEEKILKNIPLSDWLNILVFPILLYIVWVVIVKNIIERPFIPLFPFDDFDILTIAILFLVYGFVGNAIHFTSKILWRYLRGFQLTMAFRVNEMFHNKLSHYLSYLNGLFILFLLPVLEINHPLVESVSSLYIKAIIAVGAIFGASAAKAIFYTNDWFGGYNKPLFFIVSILLVAIFAFIRIYKLTLAFYPVTIFVAAMFASVIITFVVRQTFILARLGRKKKFKFLARILSA